MPIAASVCVVRAHFIECLGQEYDLAVGQLPWIGSEGGWIGPNWDVYELLHVIELDFPQENEDLLLPVLFGEFFEQDWCEANGLGLNDQDWARLSWEYFSDVVMHQRRYFFTRVDRPEHEFEAYSPSEVLQTVFDYAQHADLFRELPVGFRLVRARWEETNSPYVSPEDLGPPPAKQAKQPNRMSPAGIPMFYGCQDEATALKEIDATRKSKPNGSTVAGLGWFNLMRPALVLDLTAVPPVPSLFKPKSEPTDLRPRRVLKFLNHVAAEMSRHIDGDEKVHVEYVPTQVVTEFVRDQLTWSGANIDGIRYESSVNPGHVSFVLFATHANIKSTAESKYADEVWLELTHIVRRPVK